MNDTNAPERLSSYPDYTSDPDGLARMRKQVLESSNRHDMAQINLNSLARLLDTITTLATPAPREDGYSAGVRAAAEVFAKHSAIALDAYARSGKQWRHQVHDAILALLDAPALPDARAGAQCCMCGKNGLSTVEDGGPECELSDGRWTCSRECWERAAGAVEPLAWRWRFDVTQEWSYGDQPPGKSRFLGEPVEMERLYAAPPTPACTATDGPASACVYRAPGLGTAATFEKG